MPADFLIGQGDLGPVLEVVPIMPDGTVADIAGASLQFFMAAYGASLDTAVGAPVVLIPDPVTPKIRHHWASPETDVYGTFCFQIRGTLSDGKTYTFPTERQFYTVEIWPKL